MSEEFDAKAIAFQWLDSGANAQAFREYIKVRNRIADFERIQHAREKNPTRIRHYHQMLSAREAMEKILDIYLVGYLIKNDIADGYNARQSVFTEAIAIMDRRYH